MHHRQLEYVVAAVEEGSFTDAALRCGVAQPSLSVGIARLERELGVPLFHRIGRRVEPTDAARALLAPARDVLRATAAARQAVGDVRAGLAGHLDVAVQPAAVGSVVQLLAAFQAAHPGVHLRVLAPGDESVAELVATGAAELGIGDPGGSRAGLVTRDLWSEEYVCVERTVADRPDATVERSAPRRRPRTTRRQPADLAGAALVAAPPGSPTRDVLDQWFAAAGVEPTVAVEVDLREALVPLVAAGTGVAIVPRSLAESSGRGDIRMHSLSPRVERPVALVHRPTPLGPAASRLVELATSWADRRRPRGGR